MSRKQLLCGELSGSKGPYRRKPLNLQCFSYLFDENRDGEGAYYPEDGGTAKSGVPENFYNMTKPVCEMIMGLYAKVELYRDRIKTCENKPEFKTVIEYFGKKFKGEDYTLKIEYAADGTTTYKLSGVACDGSIEDNTCQQFIEECTFIPLQLGYATDNPLNVSCQHDGKCRTLEQTNKDVQKLDGLLKTIGVEKEKASVGKGILVGGTVGAAAGGLATGITAVIESNNIKCVVGNDLASVALNKSYTIGSLKDFYIKKGFSFMDSVLANTPVVDRNSWGVACSEFQGNQDDCQNASVIYKHDGKREVVPYACSYVGSMCLVNEDVANLFGVN